MTSCVKCSCCGKAVKVLRAEVAAGVVTFRCVPCARRRGLR